MWDDLQSISVVKFRVAETSTSPKGGALTTITRITSMTTPLPPREGLENSTLHQLIPSARLLAAVVRSWLEGSVENTTVLFGGTETPLSVTEVIRVQEVSTVVVTELSP